MHTRAMPGQRCVTCRETNGWGSRPAPGSPPALAEQRSEEPGDDCADVHV